MLPLVKVAAAIGIPVGLFLLFRKKDAAASVAPAATPIAPSPSPARVTPSAPAPSGPDPNAPGVNPDLFLPPGLHVKEENAGPFPERNVEPDGGGVIAALAGLFGGGTEVHVDGGVSPGFKDGGAAPSGGSSSGGGSTDGFFDNLVGPPTREVDQDGGLAPGFREG